MPLGYRKWSAAGVKTYRQGKVVGYLSPLAVQTGQSWC